MDSRPKDNIRLLLHVWLDDIERKALDQEHGRAEKEWMSLGASTGFKPVERHVLERWFVWRVREFLQEHPRP